MKHKSLAALALCLSLWMSALPLVRAQAPTPAAGAARAPVQLTVTQSFFNNWHITVEPAAAAAKITGVSVDGIPYKLTNSQYNAWISGMYYVDAATAKVYMPEPSDGIALSLTTADGSLGTFKYRKSDRSLTAEGNPPVEAPDEPEAEVPGDPGTPGSESGESGSEPEQPKSDPHAPGSKPEAPGPKQPGADPKQPESGPKQPGPGGKPAAQPADGPDAGLPAVLTAVQTFFTDYWHVPLDAAAAAKITGVSVDGKAYQRVDSKYTAWYPDKYHVDADGKLYMSEPADGAALTLTVSNGGQRTFRYRKSDRSLTAENTPAAPPAEPAPGSAPGSDPEAPAAGTQSAAPAMSLAVQSEFGGKWKLAVEPRESAAAVKGLLVNGRAYEAVNSHWMAFYDYKYYVDASAGEIHLNELKTGDRLTLKGDGDQVLGTFEYSRETKKMTAVSPDSPHQSVLKVRLVGHFESAMVNQRKYDAVSGATGSVSNNQNSDVEIQVAEVASADETPAETAWKKAHESGIRFNPAESAVLLDQASGMKGVYYIGSSKVSLAGIPKTPGRYPISVKVTDVLGRTATSEPLFFNVWSTSEALIDHLKMDNMTPLKSGGAYAWDIQEPWFISRFGGTNETVTVPNQLHVWFGSHKSGTYGELGVQAESPVHTLIVDRDTDLAMVNMKLNGSVNVIVRNGGKFSLIDSSVHGTVTVENGGVFSMNYDAFKKEFLTGSSINGQLILRDGAIVENALIYSNSNYLSDGKRVRQNENPVVQASGEVTVRGQVYIRGDEAPSGTHPTENRPYRGQAALGVTNGTVKLAPGAVLGAYGGGRQALTSVGGLAVVLDAGHIAGDGQLIAVGGSSFSRFQGGDAVSGTGSVSVPKAYLQGGNTYGANQTAGQPYTEGIDIAQATHGVAQPGRVIQFMSDDDQPAYWFDQSKRPPVERCDVSGLPSIGTTSAPVPDPEQSPDPATPNPPAPDPGQPVDPPTPDPEQSPDPATPNPPAPNSGQPADPAVPNPPAPDPEQPADPAEPNPPVTNPTQPTTPTQPTVPTQSTASTKSTTPPAAERTYPIIRGVDAVWTPDLQQGLLVVADAPFEKLAAVLVDSVTLRRDVDYTAVSGSTEVTLSAAYLKRLSPGSHSLAMQFSDGTARTGFAIRAVATGSTPTESTTGSTPTESTTGSTPTESTTGSTPTESTTASTPTGSTAGKPGESTARPVSPMPRTGEAGGYGWLAAVGLASAAAIIAVRRRRGGRFAR